MTRPESGDARRARLAFRAEEARVAKLEAEADMAGERVATEQENGWAVPASAIGAWLGTTVVEVVAVVLVIVNYLFPDEGREFA